MTTARTTPATQRASLDSNHAATLGEQTKRVTDDVRELGKMAISSASDALNDVKERGSEMVEHARERGSELLHDGREKLEGARDGFEEYVAENPFKSVLIAAGVGALIGFAMRGRSS